MKHELDDNLKLDSEDSRVDTSADSNIEEFKQIVRQQKELFQQQQETLEKTKEEINKLLDEYKLKAIKEVPVESVKELEVMTPADHVKKIYTDVCSRVDIYKKPPALKDYEAAVYVLKNHNIPEEKIAGFLINPNYDL